MNTNDIRARLLNRPLHEEPITTLFPGLEKAHLFLRELSGTAGMALMNSVTRADGTMNQNQLVFDIILCTLRNGDDPQRGLVFGKLNPETGQEEPDFVYRGALMEIGLSDLMALAKQSITLSGLDAQALPDAKNV